MARVDRTEAPWSNSVEGQVPSPPGEVLTSTLGLLQHNLTGRCSPRHAAAARDLHARCTQRKTLELPQCPDVHIQFHVT